MVAKKVENFLNSVLFLQIIAFTKFLKNLLKMSSVHFRAASKPGNPSSWSVLKGNLRNIVPSSTQDRFRIINRVCRVNSSEVLLVTTSKRCNPWQFVKIIKKTICPAFRPVPSPEQSKWGGISRQWRGTKINWILQIKTDILRLQLCATLTIWCSCLKKETYKAGSFS